MLRGGSDPSIWTCQRSQFVDQGPGFSRRPFAHHDAETIRLEARPLHREPREPAAVGREDGLRIPGAVLQRDAARGLGPVDLDLPEVPVRRPGLFARRELCREDHELPVRRDGDLFRAPPWEAGGVGVEASHQGNRRFVSFDGHDPQLIAGPFPPGVPMAHEQSLVKATGRRLLGHRLLAVGGAGHVGAVRKRHHGEDEALPVGRQDESGDVEGKSRDGPCLSAAEWQPPHLARAATAGEKEEALTVGRPSRVVIARRVARQLARVAVG